MKNYVAVALALASVVLATPAFAGSVSSTGGTKSTEKVIDNVYKHTTYVTRQGSDVVDSSSTNVVNNNTVINKTINKTNTTYVDGGVVNKTVDKYTYKAKVTGSESNGKTASASKSLGSSNSNVQSAINSLANQVRRELTEKGRSMYTDMDGAYFYDIKNGAVRYYTNGSNGWGVYSLMTSSSLGNTYVASHDVTSSTESKTTTDTKFNGTTSTTTSNKVLTSSSTALTAHDKVGTTSTVNTTFNGASETLTQIEYNTSPDGILVGDTDCFADAYAAQGNVTQKMHYDRDEYYTQTTTNVDHYKDTYTKTNNYTTTNTTTNVDNYTKTTTTVNTTTNKHTVVYQADLTGVTSPIILDLDGDGKIQASNGKYMPHQGDFSKNVVMFDFYGNGFPMVMEWVGTNDGLLCRPNEDGTVTGANLFGTANGYENGFDEMSTLDVDNNGSLEGAELSGLMVWTDENHNGVADKGEMHSLESLGITSIGVSHNNFVGSFVRDGKQYKSFDWWPSCIDGRKVNVAMED